MDVFDLRYMRRIRFTLWSLGGWPSFVFKDATTKWSLMRRYGYTMLLCVLCSLSMVPQALYLIKNKGILEFIDLGQTCITLLFCCVFVQRTLLPLQGSYAELIKEFASKFHLFHYRHQSDYSAKMYDKVNRICEIATIIQHVQIYIAATMYNVAPFYNNFRNGMLSSNRPANVTLEFSVNYYLPVDQNKVGWFTLVSLYNCYVSYNLGFMLCCHDLQICVFVFHIWGHLNLFEHNLNNFPRPNAVNANIFRYTNEEMKEVTAKLKQIIQYYIMIKDFVRKTSATYSITLCVYYMFHLVSDCVLLLECSTLDTTALAKYGLLTIVVYQQLMQLSVVFELISSKSDALTDAVYGLPWECMDTSNRRTVLILLQIVQQSLAIKACNMVSVGVQTMMAVLKASFSYFMMLKTFA